MKKVFLAAVGLFILMSTVFAQDFQGINYQSIVTDNNGNTLANQSVSFRFSILKGSITGEPVYSEKHFSNTSDDGLINLVIGKGSTLNSFKDIDWASDSYFLKIEMDETGGGNFKYMGTSQFWAVPYALFAANAPGGDGNSTDELQELSISGNQLSISEGNTVTLPTSTGSSTSYWKNNNGGIAYTAGPVSIGTTNHSDNASLTVESYLSVQSSNKEVVGLGSGNTGGALCTFDNNSNLKFFVANVNNVATLTTMGSDQSENVILYSTGDGDIGAVSAYNGKSSEIATLAGNSNGGYLATFNNESGASGQIATDKDGYGYFMTCNDDGSPLAYSDGDEYGGRLLTLNNDGIFGSELTFLEDIGPVIRNYNDAGDLTSIIGNDSDGGMLKLFNDNGGLITSIIPNTRNGGYFSNYNREGNFTTEIGSLDDLGGCIFNYNGLGIRTINIYNTDSGDGTIKTYSSDGSLNTQINSYIDGGGVFITYNSEGEEMSRMGTTSRSGYFDTKSTDGNINVRITSLEGYPGHGYVSVCDDDGEAQIALYVNSTGKGEIHCDELWVDKINGYSYNAFSTPLSASVGDQQFIEINLLGSTISIRGEGSLVNGNAVINFNPEFTSQINSATLTVMLTPKAAESKGLAVIEENEGFFRVAELMSGTGNYKFNWEAKATMVKNSVKSGKSSEIVQPIAEQRAIDTAKEPEQTSVRRLNKDLSNKKTIRTTSLNEVQ